MIYLSGFSYSDNLIARALQVHKVVPASCKCRGLPAISCHPWDSVLLSYYSNGIIYPSTGRQWRYMAVIWLQWATIRPHITQVWWTVIFWTSGRADTKISCASKGHRNKSCKSSQAKEHDVAQIVCLLSGNSFPSFQQSSLIMRSFLLGGCENIASPPYG